MNEFEIEERSPTATEGCEVKNYEPEVVNDPYKKTPVHPVPILEEVKEETDNGRAAPQEQLQLPPYPDCILFDVTEEQAKIFKYTGDPNDVVNRMRFKLFLVWQIWAKARNNEKTIQIINQLKDKDSDEFVLGNELVCLIDEIGRTLSATHITEELFKVD